MQTLNLKLAAQRLGGVRTALYVTSILVCCRKAPWAFPSFRSTMALNPRDLPGEWHEFNEHGN